MLLIVVNDNNCVFFCPGTVERHQDTIFELISICYEYSLWLMKHASWIASQENVDMESAKQVHSSLRRAAGVLTCIQIQW